MTPSYIVPVFFLIAADICNVRNLYPISEVVTVLSNICTLFSKLSIYQRIYCSWLQALPCFRISITCVTNDVRAMVNIFYLRKLNNNNLNALLQSLLRIIIVCPYCICSFKSYGKFAKSVLLLVDECSSDTVAEAASFLAALVRIESPQLTALYPRILDKLEGGEGGLGGVCFTDLLQRTVPQSELGTKLHLLYLDAKCTTEMYLNAKS